MFDDKKAEWVMIKRLPSIASTIDPINMMIVCKVSVNITADKPPGRER